MDLNISKIPTVKSMLEVGGGIIFGLDKVIRVEPQEEKDIMIFDSFTPQSGENTVRRWLPENQ